MAAIPFITAARQIYELSLGETRAAVEGLSVEGLNWKPGAEDTNSIAVLTTHMLASCRDWLCIATDTPRRPRSRSQEFLSAFDAEATALTFIDEIGADTLTILEEAASIDWAAPLSNPGQPGDPDQTHAYALIHAIEHLREHVAHLQLTRQLWEARLKSSSV